MRVISNTYSNRSYKIRCYISRVCIILLDIRFDQNINTLLFVKIG